MEKYWWVEMKAKSFIYVENLLKTKSSMVCFNKTDDA